MRSADRVLEVGIKQPTCEQSPPQLAPGRICIISKSVSCDTPWVNCPVSDPPRFQWKSCRRLRIKPGHNAAFLGTNERRSTRSMFDKCSGLKPTVEQRSLVRKHDDTAKGGKDVSSLRRHTWLYLAHDDLQNFDFLVRLHQRRDNCSNFIEYLVPAL